MQCRGCRLSVANHVTLCPHCATWLDFPNVRAAGDPAEQAALNVRYDQACSDARTRNAATALTLFEEAVKTASRGVITRSLGTLNNLIISRNVLFRTFYQQVADGRVPEENEFDPYRPSTDHRLFPYYAERIHFATLSIGTTGAASYGGEQPCVLLLNETIQNRASLFEENSFIYCRRIQQPVAATLPPGLRATWANRHRLAVAKLGHLVTATTTPTDFPGILVEAGKTSKDEKFIEIHIHDPLTEAAVEKIRLPKVKSGLTKTKTKVEKALLKAVQEKLELLDVACEVV
jgi:hypothetical protein